jgi:hypothetical protein
LEIISTPARAIPEIINIFQHLAFLLVGSSYAADHFFSLASHLSPLPPILLRPTVTSPVQEDWPLTLCLCTLHRQPLQYSASFGSIHHHPPLPHRTVAVILLPSSLPANQSTFSFARRIFCNARRSPHFCHRPSPSPHSLQLSCSSDRLPIASAAVRCHNTVSLISGSNPAT